MSRKNLLIVPLLLLVSGFCLGPMRESDLFFRIQAGREILAHHELPARNLFSFTYPSFPDLDTAWAFEVIAAWLHAVGGFHALVLAKTTLVLLAFVGAWWLCRRRGAGVGASALTLAAAALVMRDRMVERPHLASFVFELLLAGCVMRPQGPPRSALLALPLMVAVWANFHAGVFLAPLLLAGYAAGALLDRRRDLALRSSVLASLAVPAMLLTPVGTGIFRYLVVHLEITKVHTVDEFRSATLVSDPALMVFGAALALAVFGPAVIALIRRGGGRDVGDPELRLVMPVAVTAVLGFSSVRFAADLAMVAAPVLACRVQATLDTALGWRPQLARLRRLGTVALAGVLLLALVAERVAAVRAGEAWLDVGLDRESLPLDAIAFAERHGLRERMYNDFEIGSYLAFEGFPRHRVFVDPRLPAYPVEFHRLLGRFDVSRAEWDVAMSGHGVNAALLGYAGLNRRVAWWDPASWALVYRQHDARIFVRRLERWRDFIAAHEIPASFSFTVEDGAVTLPLEEPPPGSPVPRCEWQRRLGDLMFELEAGRVERPLAEYRRALSQPGCLSPAAELAATSWIGSLELQRGELDHALVHLARAVELDASDGRSRAGLALTLERLDRGGEARTEWLELARQQPATELGQRARQRALALAGAR